MSKTQEMRMYFCDEVAKLRQFDICYKKCLLNRHLNEKMCEGCRESIDEFLRKEANLDKRKEVGRPNAHKIHR